MGLTHRCASALLLLAFGLPAWAAPFTIYDNEFKAGWQNWSWAKVETPPTTGEVKPLKVQGDAWSALALHHDAFSTAQFSKVTFYIHGGAEGGQNLSIKAMADGKALESSYVIKPKAKAWTIVDVPLADLAAANRTIDGLMLQAGGSSYKPYYITRIQFE